MDTPGPGECYAEAVVELQRLEANPGVSPVEWLSYDEALRQARERVEQLEAVKHLSHWPDPEDCT